MTDRNSASYFAIGALSPRERADVARQRLSDPVLDAQIDENEAMLAPLAGVAGSMALPPGMKARVMAAIMSWDDFQHGGKRSFEFGSGNWRTVFPGVEMKRLWAKGPKIMRCAPASVIPAHDHPEHEHLVVLSGDFLLEGRRFSIGDHLSSPPGSHHDMGTTRTGCILLLYGV
jgi:hypothetical protein